MYSNSKGVYIMKYEFTDEEVNAIKVIMEYCKKQSCCDSCVFYQDSPRNGITYKFCHNILPIPRHINTVIVEEYKNIYERD